MVVIVIVGILSGVALPNFLSQTEKAKATEAKTAGSAAFKTITASYLENSNILQDPATGLGVKVADGGLCPDDTTVFVYACTNPNDGNVTITGTIQEGTLAGTDILTNFDAAVAGKPEICSDEAKTGLQPCV